MIQIQDSLRAIGRQRILCSYSNRKERAQIIRVSDISSWYERVVFPGEGLLFEALPESCLEIYSDEMPTTILADKIPCSQLEIGLASYAAELLRSQLKINLASYAAELLRTPSIDDRGRNGGV